MKLNFNFKNKEASIEADIEKIIDKNMDIKSNKPPKKTSYQIKQEEKRKNMELEHKQQMHIAIFGAIAFAIIIALCIVMGYLEQ